MVWKLTRGADEASKVHKIGKLWGHTGYLPLLGTLFKIDGYFGTHMEFGLWRKKK